jgi:phosphoribosylformylglycinamidine synthase
VSARWVAEVRVELRSGIADPEGQTIGSALRSLGYAVDDVRHGKLLRIVFVADDRGSAEVELAEMCRRLLANPVMEVASWELAEEPVAEVGVVAR